MTMPVSRQLRLWLIRIVAWDGLLPAAIWSAPFVVELLFPNRRGAVEITAVALPIVAFLIRFYVGRQYILTNGCGVAMRLLQIVALCIGILLLVLIDAVVVLTHVMPRGAAVANSSDLIVWAILYAVYVSSMALALYPGMAFVERVVE